MKRRSFIKRAALLPFLLGRFPVGVFGVGSFWNSVLSAGPADGKVLVLIELEGGNDGLNTLIPLDKYTALSAARGNILIPEKKTLLLPGHADSALHPSLTGIYELYKNEQALFVQGVGYPNQDYSHFKSLDIWLSGNNDPLKRQTGWLGRFLDKGYAGYPAGYPNAANPDPLAIRIGAVSSKITTGISSDMGIAVSPSSISDEVMATNYSDPLPDTYAGTAVHSIRENYRLTGDYAPRLKSASDKQATLSHSYPGELVNPLADQLKIVARLIGGGLQTKVYVLNQKGYDTHATQSDQADAAVGIHAGLLAKLSEAIFAFQEDITLMGQQDRVIGLTFSEFGRRIMSNASLGTDHGSSQPLLLFGSKVKKGGIVGSNPEIPVKATPDDNLLLQHDFRAVYSSVLKGWLGVPGADLQNIFGGAFEYIDLFKS